MSLSRRIITCASCRRFRPPVANNWCHACYQRWRRHGRPASGPPAPREPQGCGTDAAYQRHVKYGEPIDERCRQARNTAQNRRRSKAKASSSVREQWTDEQTRAAYTIALATEGRPTDRRLLLEALGLARSSATSVTGVPLAELDGGAAAPAS